MVAVEAMPESMFNFKSSLRHTLLSACVNVMYLIIEVSPLIRFGVFGEGFFLNNLCTKLHCM